MNSLGAWCGACVGSRGEVHHERASQGVIAFWNFTHSMASSVMSVVKW